MFTRLRRGSYFQVAAFGGVGIAAPVWDTIPSQEWEIDTGVQTLDLSQYLISPSSITDLTVTVLLLNAEGEVFEGGVFEDGVFEGGGSEYVSVSYTEGIWQLSIDTDETGELTGAVIELRAENSAGLDDTSFEFDVVPGEPAENFALTLNGSDELVFEGVASTLVLNGSDELEINYA